MTRLTPKETGREGIMRAVTDLLTVKHILWFRMNAGDRIVPGKNGKRYRIRGHAKGTADILFFLANRRQVVWVEVKRPGASQTAEQWAFQGLVETEYDHTYLLISDLSQLQAWLKEQGR
jgi:hypothetical protein